MFTADQMTIIKKSADEIGVEVNKLLAFMLTETNGQVYAVVNGKNEPLIRWEGHYFYKLIKASLRQRAVEMKLASPKVGGIPNPAGQEGRWALLNKGKSLDISAAISSVSWGIGQVMGAHWQWLGYSSAQDFENKVRSGFVGQLTAMTLFLDRSGIIPHLKRGDWSAVARIYNGKDYAKNKYDVKMRDHYVALTGVKEEPKSAGMLRSGSKGAGVRELQKLLVRAGFSIDVDGDFGPSTERAVRLYQKNNGLEIDGVAGPATMKALQKLKVTPSEDLATQKTMDNSTVKNGLISGVGGSAVLVAAKEQVDNASAQLASLAGGPVVDYLSSGLAIASAALVLGGLAYAAYGWWNKDKTFHGTEQLA